MLIAKKMTVAGLLVNARNFEQVMESEYKTNESIDELQYSIEVVEASKLLDRIADKGNAKENEDFLNAVKYFLVVLSCRTKHLDYKKAYKDLGIAELAKRYPRND